MLATAHELKNVLDENSNQNLNIQVHFVTVDGSFFSPPTEALWHAERDLMMVNCIKPSCVRAGGCNMRSTDIT